MLARLLNLFKSPAPVDTTPVAEPKQVVWEPKILAPEVRDTLKAFALRKGMWVKTEEGVGIVRDITMSEGTHYVDVMLVDDHGHNKLPVQKQPTAVVQASYDHIPAKRKQHRDKEHFHALGYK